MSVDDRIEAVSLPDLSISVGDGAIAVEQGDDEAVFELGEENVARYQGDGFAPEWAENALRQIGAIVE